jgi:transposase-like protein
MAGRKIHDEQEARRCLAAVRSSKGELAAWARAHGIDGRSLNAWRANLERGGVPLQHTVGSKLVELVPAATVMSTPARYVLRFDRVELEVGDDFNEVSLRRLIGLLKSC